MPKYNMKVTGTITIPVQCGITCSESQSMEMIYNRLRQTIRQEVRDFIDHEGAIDVGHFNVKVTPIEGTS